MSIRNAPLGLTVFRAFLFSLALPMALFAQEPTPATAPASAPAAPAPAAEVKLPAQKDFYLFILTGQSNMAGRGKVDEEGATPKERIFALNKADNWQPAVDPLHWDKSAAGSGLGRPFAERVLPTMPPGTAIGLVPTACGGSSITAWVPGAYHDQTKSKPYDDFLTRTRRAMKDGTVKAILWHQGEGDCEASKTEAYEGRLTELIARMREDLGAPDLPFIIGQLGNFPGKGFGGGQKRIDAAHRAVAAKVKNVYFVESEGLLSKGDNLHFDTASLRIFGRNYADAYLKAIGATPAPASAKP